MRTGYENLAKLYTGISMINRVFVDSTFVIPTMQKIPDTVMSSIFRYAGIIGVADINISMGVNVGDKGEPMYIILIQDKDSEKRWETTVDKVLNGMQGSTYVISLSASVFLDMMDIHDIMFTLFMKMLELDKDLSFKPTAGILNKGDSNVGAAIPTYDYVMNIYTLYMIHSTLYEFISDYSLSEGRDLFFLKGYDEEILDNVLLPIFKYYDEKNVNTDELPLQNPIVVMCEQL